MPTTRGMRGVTSRWRYRTEEPPAGGDLVGRILAVRGLDESAGAAFLEPTLTQLHDPSLIPGMDRAAERLLGAARAGEPIVIYGDYDVDGITATAILFHMLRAIAPACAVRTYVPHRLEEGYGLNAAAIGQLAAEGARVIVSVDCGITAVAPAGAARAAGVDLVITDHHNLPGDGRALPEAFAIVHPRLAGSAYPFDELSGAGVAYKLAWRMATMHCRAPRVTEDLRALLLELLAFAALGTIADVVPLVGENRVLARFGLSRIKRSSFAGLRALVEASGLAGDEIGAEHVGFVLGPRLNACGRMGHAREAVELFTTAPAEQHEAIARNLTRLNQERRATEQAIAAQAAEMTERAGMASPERRAIVLAHEDWHPGVVGIVCSRLVEKFCRPTILMQRKDGQCHGSGRSVEGFSLHGALERCAGHLLTYGGHDMAAGVRLEASCLEAFAAAFIEEANARIDAEQLVPSLGIDCDAGLEELSVAAVGRLEHLAPFGQTNPRPRVRIPGVRLMARPQGLGDAGKHIALRVTSGGAAMRMVGWNWADRAASLAEGMTLDVVVSPKLSRWNGRVTVEPEISDLNPVG